MTARNKYEGREEAVSAGGSGVRGQVVQQDGRLGRPFLIHDCPTWRAAQHVLVRMGVARGGLRSPSSKIYVACILQSTMV